MPDTAATIGLLARLVSHPTVSDRSNLDLIDFVEAYLSERGAETTRFTDGTGRKASLFASIGQGEAPLLLSGHTDVVPVEGQSWSSDPFRLTEQSGRLYGRGTADMKGFLACMLAAADDVSRGDLPGRLQLAFSYDEEVGCKGVDALLGHVAALAQPPRLCVIGEPTLMRVVVGHKGKVAAKVTCTGVPGHSSDPSRGINAIEMATEAIGVLQRTRDTMATSTSAHNYSPAGSTINIGTIMGGSQVNVIAERCAIEFEIRSVPGQNIDAVLRSLSEDFDLIAHRYSRPPLQARIDMHVITKYPWLQTSPDQFVEWTGALGEERDVVSYGTEAGLFASLGQFPVIVCGPGSIEQAHRSDEFVTVDQLEQCSSRIGRMLAASSALSSSHIIR